MSDAPASSQPTSTAAAPRSSPRSVVSGRRSKAVPVLPLAGVVLVGSVVAVVLHTILARLSNRVRRLELLVQRPVGMVDHGRTPKPASRSTPVDDDEGDDESTDEDPQRDVEPSATAMPSPVHSPRPTRKKGRRSLRAAASEVADSS